MSVWHSVLMKAFFLMYNYVDISCVSIFYPLIHHQKGKTFCHYLTTSENGMKNWTKITKIKTLRTSIHSTKKNC